MCYRGKKFKDGNKGDVANNGAIFVTYFIKICHFAPFFWDKGYAENVNEKSDLFLR